MLVAERRERSYSLYKVVIIKSDLAERKHLIVGFLWKKMVHLNDIFELVNVLIFEFLKPCHRGGIHTSFQFLVCVLNLTVFYFVKSIRINMVACGEKFGPPSDLSIYLLL